jgi:subtilisin family serine protease
MGMLGAQGLRDNERSVRAQQRPYTLDENLTSFPDGVPPRSGVVEVDPALAPVSRPSPAMPTGNGDGKVRPEVLEALTQQLDARVIVSLREPTGLRATPLEIASVKRQVAGLQNQVLTSLAPGEFRLTYRYEATPALAGSVSPGGLDKLAAHPDVVAVSLDTDVHVLLAESAPMIGANEVHALGFTGAGAVAAVLDTGLDTDHPDLADDLLAEECRLSATSDCPNGTATQSGPGAAEDDHSHGSNVTGIITGGGVVSPVGVAPDTGIVAYKILNAAGNGSISDVLAAADDIIANHPEVDIINMSLGDGASHVPGTCDALFPALTGAFSTLRSQNVIPFAASGNEAFKTGISYPACLSDVVSVGAVYDANLGARFWSTCADLVTAADQVTCFSNSHPGLDLLGPGALITSAGLAGGTSTKGGTSMASPHAAGVAALVRQAGPSATGDSIVAILKSTGVPVTDTANGVTTPRVAALAAVQAVVEPPTSTPAPTSTPSVTATGTPTPSAPAFGANVRVNQDASSRPQNEPSITINPADPNKLVAGANDYRCLAATCSDGHPGVYRSTNEGASWSDAGVGGGVAGILPDPPGFIWGSRNTSGELAGGDPALAWGLGNDVYYGFIAFNDVASSAGGVYVSKSTDAGLTWGAPVLVQANSETEFQDKDYVAIDGNPGSPFSGRVYMSWTRFQNSTHGGRAIAAPIVLSYSDNGAAWSSPKVVSAPGSSCNQGSIPAVAPDATLYVAWWNCDATPQRILVAKSTDGGDSFSAPVQVAQVATIPSPLPPSSFRTNSFPAIATDATDPDLVYVTWASDPAGADDADVFFSRSTDGGSTWSAPLRVNDDATTNDQFFQWISVGADGRIDVIFADRRDDPGDSFYNTYYAASSDNGVSFQANVRLTDVASDPDIDFGGGFIGDYFNVVSASVHAAWTDTRNGHQDIFAAVGTTPVTDSDGDGCTDADESAMGFDPLAWYDFYDVPVPANADPTPNGSRDGTINLGDVLAVLFYVPTSDNGGLNANGVDYDSLKDGDWNGDTVVDELDEAGRRYDRRPGVKPNPPWEVGPPDNTINLADVIAELAQIGLDCSGPP